MAVPYAKIPGSRERALENVVPGLHGRDGRGGLRVPLTGWALRMEKRRRKWGVVLGWTSLGCSLIFVGSVVVAFLAGAGWSGLDAVIFGWIWGLAAVVVHPVVFVAEALRGRDAPGAVLAVILFWIGTLAAVAM